MNLVEYPYACTGKRNRIPICMWLVSRGRTRMTNDERSTYLRNLTNPAANLS